MTQTSSKWTSVALFGGSLGLVLSWFGTKLFFDLGGIFGFGGILVLSTLLLIFGTLGLYLFQRSSSAKVDRLLLVIGMVVTAVGLVSSATITLAGLALFTAGSIRSKMLPVIPLALILFGAILLGFEEWRYGALLATRMDQPVSAGTPLVLVRWLAGAGYVAEAVGWSWLGITLWRLQGGPHLSDRREC